MNKQERVETTADADATRQNGPPVVSVIVPVHNGATTLAETVDSAFAQTVESIEVLVIDDGSSDGTPAVLRNLTARHGPRLRSWRLEPNRGPSAARNFGFARARAPLIAPLDADDLWLPDKLERQVSALAREPQAVVAYSWTAHIDGEGRYLNPGGQARHQGDVFRQVVLGNFLDCGSNPLVRASAWRAVGGYEPTLRAAEDWDFYIRLSARGAFVVVPQTQVYYRKHRQSTSATNVLAIEASALQVVDRVFASLEDPAGRLRDATLANLYKYFTQLVYEGQPAGWRGLTGARFIGAVLHHDARLWRQPGLVALLVLKALTGLLPGEWAGTVEGHFARLPGLRLVPGAHHRPMATLQTELPNALPGTGSH